MINQRLVEWANKYEHLRERYQHLQRKLDRMERRLIRERREHNAKKNGKKSVNTR